MKKILTVLVLMAISLYTYSQSGEKSLLLKAGYQTDYKRFGLGVEGRYGLPYNFRLAPDLTVFFPKDHVTGLDANVNVHYVAPIQGGLSLYPLAGLGIVNNRYSNDGHSHGNTDIAFNLGFGAEYALDGRGYLNGEFKYMFSDMDSAVFMFGYGLRF